MIKKYKANPIIDKYTPSQYDPNDLHVVFNPGVFESDGWIYLVARAEFRSGISKLVAYRSRNGLTRWQSVSIDSFPAEDPRVVCSENGTLYCTYTRVNGKSYQPAFRRLYVYHSECKISVGYESLMFYPHDKDVVIFPKRINGLVWVLHRPEIGQERNIWITSGSDVYDLNRHYELICAGEKFPWKSSHVGAGCPPIETDEGWLILYHGVKATGSGPIYRMGAALLDRNEPTRLLSELPYWIMAPEKDYERIGNVPNVVFPTGCIQKGNTLRIYYGAADQSICVADLDLKKLLGELKEYPKKDYRKF